MRPICVKCEVELRMEQAGIYVAEMFRENKEVYKLWRADLWKCPICKTEIVHGFGNNPIAEHFDTGVDKRVKLLIEKGEKVVFNKEVKYL